MANPQLENGHICIANEILEAFYRLQLSGYQIRILSVILRQTYGWHKKEDKISISFFEKKTGIKRRHVVRTLNELIQRQIIFKNVTITKNGNVTVNSYGLQKDYQKWKLSSGEVTITENGNAPITEIGNTNVTKNGNSLLLKLVPTKDTSLKNTSLKETIQKKESKTIYKDIHTKSLTPPIDAPPYMQETETLSKPETEAVTESVTESKAESLTPLSNKNHSTLSPPTSSKNKYIPYADIVDYLNKKTGKSFRVTNKQTQKLIKARWIEGNTLEDFYKVIDHQTAKWRDDKKMCEYLRPETLFGPKFESYLQSPPTVVQADIISSDIAEVIDWAESENELDMLHENKQDIPKEQILGEWKAIFKGHSWGSYDQ